MGLPVDDPAVTAYTAIIQVGAIAATFLYFAKKIARLFLAWVRSAEAREERDYTLAWAVIVGSLPVGIVGFLARDLISAAAQPVGGVGGAHPVEHRHLVAEQRHDVLERQGIQRDEHSITLKDGLVIGLVQCFSLIPGVSRSGATISAGLMRGINRVTATELSFFMAIPALTAAGIFELARAPSTSSRWASARWSSASSSPRHRLRLHRRLLRFVATNSLRPFIWYRVGLGLLVAVALGAGLDHGHLGARPPLVRASRCA